MNSPINHNSWRIAELIQTTSEVLAKKLIEPARLNAELLLSAVLKLARVDLYLNYDRLLAAEELSQFRMLVRRRLAHEPLQYILGEAEFMSLKFRVTPDVLIPRPDTETLVEWVMECYRTAGRLRILDLGTGSGNIAISLAHYLPNAQVIGVDISLAGLQVAVDNVHWHGVEKQVQFIQTDFTAARFLKLFRHPFDVIVSNPPYIPEEQFSTLAPEVARYEPAIALVEGKKNGFFYQKIAELAPTLLQQQGAVLVELGHGQDENVKAIFSAPGFLNIEIRHDLAGIPRVLKARWE